jgi:CRISPR-associated protein Csm1
MSHGSTPKIDEIALGAFFEDIGKFMQRAFGPVRLMDPAARARDHEILPPDGHGGYTHKHALWTEAFFEWMEHNTSGFPTGVNLAAVRDAAVYHHHPRTALHWLSAIADRLSAGMDRAARDDAVDPTEASKAWDAFRKKPLVCIFDQIDIGRGSLPAPGAYHMTPLAPESMFPDGVDGETLPKLYAQLWDAFTTEFKALCAESGNADVFQQGLLSLSERYTWAIPSSTVDHPDVSLYDHNRTVAAFAACLYRHHEVRGELDSETAIKDLERHKFRILVGDLSGIQSSLFRLQSEGVKGVNRTLRARSFLMGEIGEAAALLCRRQFGLPPWVVLQNAGGRFQMLVPDVPDIDAQIESLRRRIDGWMLQRYTGDLILNLALTAPLAGRDFHADRFPETLRSVAAATDGAKQRALSTHLTAIGAAKIGLAYPADGTCAVCGVRPARTEDDGDATKRCDTCADENGRGRKVPKAAVVALLERSGGGLFNTFDLRIDDESLSEDDRRALVAGFRVWGRDVESGPFASRFLANHVPLLRAGDGANGRYAGLEDADDVVPGDAKVFQQLAADAMEWDERAGVFRGRAMLAVLKADVDDLGFVFGCGFTKKRTTIGRLAQLSRMLDGFFTGYLTHLLATDDAFRNSYTVYAGGDDLLLIAPWLTAIRLAQRLRRDFGRFVNGNPNLTLSAGIEFCGVNEPLNRVVRRAEERLERAKHHPDKDRVSLVAEDDDGIPWTGGSGSLDWALAEADWLNDRIRNGSLPPTFLHRMLDLDRQRRGGDPGWRAKWGYHVGRLIDRLPGDASRDIGERLDRLMSGRLFDGTAAGGTAGEQPDLRIPLTIALYRNR